LAIGQFSANIRYPHCKEQQPFAGIAFYLINLNGNRNYLFNFALRYGQNFIEMGYKIAKGPNQALQIMIGRLLFLTKKTT
jgi:hypothetical protein